MVYQFLIERGTEENGAEIALCRELSTLSIFNRTVRRSINF